MANNPVSAQAIYATMKPFALTREQQAAIELAPTDAPSMVVAGAGSGKTELMAVRVLWLVANGHARPDQILGLTFTRKAASELSKRIYKSLLMLRETELWPADLPKDFAQPTVTTYNAYANSLYRENALALGLEQETTLLTEAAAFQLAREVVLKYVPGLGLELAELELRLDSIVGRVLGLAGSMSDNLVDAGQIANLSDSVLGVISGLPKKAGSNDGTAFGYYGDLLDPFPKTATLAYLAEAYQTEKYRLGYVDYSDQVALAERAVRQLPAVGTAQRERFSQVLLDEYQDTSYLQTRLLSGLFAGTAVFAVGDPNQSIYGWRGASASNLANFSLDFDGATATSAEPSAASATGNRFELSTSWRNPVKVLQLANHLAKELTQPASFIGSEEPHLVPLTLQSRSDAPDGSVLVKVEQTIEDEAEAVATWLAHHRDQNPADVPTAAVLMRTKKQMQLFREAIEAKGFSVEVVGLGGLLELSEIIDLTSALKVMHDPTSGTELVRLLTGARWRIGPKDIDRLFRFAKRQNSFHLKEEAVAPEDSLSLVDALDLLLTPERASESRISEIGLARMQNAARVFANLRQQVGLPLVELVRLVERELWLDVEVTANPRKNNPMQHLNAFAAIVANYAQSNHRPHLGAFLRWLEFAETREKLEAPASAPVPGVVQLMTVHASKGLEWDLVAVSNLVQGDFPSEGRGTAGWLTAGQLPYPLRGDKRSLPSWSYAGVQTQGELKKSVDAFKDDVKQHLYREELRLIYVAVTRPKQALLLTGSYWKPAVKKAVALSVFLKRASELPSEVVTVVERRDGDNPFPPQEANENPLMQTKKTETWPTEPLGASHGLRVAEGAQLVRNALLSKLRETKLDELELLLREREMRAEANLQVALPARINASAFKDYVLKPEETAARMQRPLPQAPYAATMAGTLFHNTMEQRNAALINALGRETDLDIADESERIWASELQTKDLAQHAASIEKMQANFAKSRWADRVAVEAEIEIQLAIGANIFVCKLDAVFQNQDGTFEIVDWKTGMAPKGAAEIAERELQLGLYRIAFATLRGIPTEKISTSLYYVSEDIEISQKTELTLEELIERWNEVGS